jgi:hypothetical protein
MAAFRAWLDARPSDRMIRLKRPVPAFTPLSPPWPGNRPMTSNPRQSTTSSSRVPRLRWLAASLIVFGASGLIAAEVVTPLLRGADVASAPVSRTVISFDQRGYVSKLPKGAAPAADAAAPYGCRSVLELGTLTIGRACNTRILSVAATE